MRVFILLGLISLSGLHAAETDFFLQQWNCTKQERKTKVKLTCAVYLPMQWNLSDFRQWSFNRPAKDIHLTIRCLDRGTISLRRPIKARFLRSLTIKDCFNTEEFDDFEDNERIRKYPNDLRKIHLDNMTFVIRSGKLQQQIIMYENITALEGCFSFIPTALHEFRANNVGFHTLDTGELLLTPDKNYEVMLYREENQCYFNLRKFELTNAKILPASLFSFVEVFFSGKLPYLQLLNFSGMGYNEFPLEDGTVLDWFHIFPHLNTVDLSANNFKHIPLTITLPQRQFKLIMQNNSIADISYDTLKKLEFSKGAIVDFSRNMFDCSMKGGIKNLIDLISNEKRYKFLLNKSAFSQTFVPFNALSNYCSLNGSSDVLTEQTGEHHPMLTKQSELKVYYVMLKVSGIVLSLILCCCFVLIYLRFKKEIQILSFTRVLIKVISRPNRNTLMKEYDAFVAYSQADEKWVTEKLCHHLEHSPVSYRLCLDYRNFAIGAPIANNIIECIEKSRHSILVLSNSFLESEWCIFEFRKAFHQTLKDRKNHMIVIVLRGTHLENIEQSLDFYLKTHTYLNQSEKFFWDKLVYALSE